MANHVVIVGAGPAGLMAAEVLVQAGITVDVYDAMRSPGRKFLLAGIGGMNITHAESFDIFVSRYAGCSEQLRPLLEQFGPTELRDWIHSLGIETFVGSSGRVFPREMKAAPLLRRWLHRLRGAGVRIHARHRWSGWQENTLLFDTPDGEKPVTADAVILALGGASWPVLGSDAAWLPLLKEKQVSIAPLQPANCGFDVQWSDFFADKFAGHPLKNISANGISGECVITATGIEGSLVYALSAALRETINAGGSAKLLLDLAPDRSEASLAEALSRPRGKRSVSEHWRRSAGFDGVKAALLRECVPQEFFSDAGKIAAAIKALPVELIAPRPMVEAISTAGGVLFESLDNNLMLRALPGFFCAGEMLDWEAPTGGYLLTACFATGRAAGQGALRWLSGRVAESSSCC